MQRAFDPGQIARMLGVSVPTVSKWIDSGRLPGYRIPFNKRRKVRHDDLVKFCREHNLEFLFEPLRPLGKWIKRKTVLLCGCDPSLIRALEPHLAEQKVDQMVVEKPFDLAALAVQRKVIGVAIDFAIGREHAIDVGQQLGTLKRELQKIALVYSDVGGVEDPIHTAFDHVVTYPFDIVETAEMLSLARRERH